MTDKNVADLGRHGVMIAGAPSAGTTTVLRHCPAGRTVGERVTDAVVPLRRGTSGVQS
jgi:hypothetical protein